MKPKFSDLISPKGTIGRSEYVFWGLVLFAVKYNIDRLIAMNFFHKSWWIWEYLFPTQKNLPTSNNRPFFTVLLLAALPFIWSGCVLTIRRLRSAGLPVWLVVLFFVPIVNLFLFALLLIVPPAEHRVRIAQRSDSFRLKDLIPRSKIGSAFFALLLNAVSAIIFTRFSVQTLNQYGWGLFVGLPFCLGLTSSLIYSYREPRKWIECVVVALIALGIAGAVLFVVAFEGMICLLMAAPLLGVLAMLGASLGYFLQFQAGSQAKVYCVSNLLVLAIMFLQSAAQPKPTMFAVTTTMEIQAAPQTVWKNVISFSELPPPDEFIFRAGIAFPTRAEIHGAGVGAVRHCRFSTGAFVEPITVWDEPNLLRFSVDQNPEPMQEWTIYHSIHPPHLKGFFLSQQGEFLLVPISQDRTLLKGTTWYYHNLWPETYWKVWCDFVIHTIHKRVMRHIKNLSEA
ncbi:MAG TPA: DUF805 domain-containing protein [Acidobacteriota bacterium]|nr:DUF805 domain-containing protein [Acidobacteriota bacterium]